MKSGIFNLKTADFIKGFIMAVGTPVLYFLQEYIPTLDHFSPIVKIAISAALTYLLKNYFTKTNVEAAKTIETVAKEEKVSAGEVVSTLTNT